MGSGYRLGERHVNLSDYIGSWRSWFPVPANDNGINLVRWLLLEGDRYAITGALLTVTFVSIIAIGSLWTFEMNQLLTETQAVQMVLNTFLSGIILLVSIVVSINSIILSYDITHINTQEDQIEGMIDFQTRVGRITGAEEPPTDPHTFLKVMAETIQRETNEVVADMEGIDESFTEEIERHLEQITGTTEHIESSINEIGGGKFSALWVGFETDYGPMVNRSRKFTDRHESDLSDGGSDHFDTLIEALELFATGREYFITLYYTREIAELSRTLLFVSLPAIVVTASTILAIDAQLLPDIWVFGLPPLMTFVALSMVIALAPFIVLTAYMLRVATVAKRTASAGPFVFDS